MDKYTFIDRYFHSQRELLDIRHSEERDNIARGYFDLAGRNSTQIDLKTWLQYRADQAPVVLREEELPFNC